MSATMKDVAERAGVSVATVSRVLNDKGPVREATRERVRATMRALNYTPDGAARSLKTRKTRTLGALLPDLYGEFFTEIVRGIDQAAREEDYHLLTSGSHDDEDELEAVLKALRGRVDGLLLMSSRISVERFETLVPARLPVVVIGGQAAARPYDVLNVANFQGARAIVSHLIEAHGHERIATITGPLDGRDAAERLRGYRVALAEEGITQDDALEVEGDFLQETGYRLARRLLHQPNPPTAFFAANDSMALGTLSALHEADLRVPGDAAVAGFDDIPSSRYMTPSLSTVHVPSYEMGRCAAERLIEAIRSEEAASGWSKVFPATVKLRASCGCAAEATAPATGSNR